MPLSTRSRQPRKQPEEPRSILKTVELAHHTPVSTTRPPHEQRHRPDCIQQAGRSFALICQAIAPRALGFHLCLSRKRRGYCKGLVTATRPHTVSFPRQEAPLLPGHRKGKNGNRDHRGVHCPHDQQQTDPRRWRAAVECKQMVRHEISAPYVHAAKAMDEPFTIHELQSAAGTGREEQQPRT